MRLALAMALATVLPGCAHVFGGAPKSVKIQLEAVALDGTSRPGAVATVDGQPAGTTPVELRLAPGPHVFELTLGSESVRDEVRVGTRHASVKLAPHIGEWPDTIPPEAVNDVVRGDLYNLKTCYRLLMAKRGTAAGTVTWSFEIREDGSVAWAFVTYSELRDADAEECMAARVRRLTFARPAGGPAHAEYSLTFARDHRPTR